MKHIPAEEREFVRGEIAWLAARLSKKYGLDVSEARQYLREVLTVAV